MTSPETLPEWELLLKAIVADPDDDLPRLVFADWLDEHDESERAEFIRIQVERVRNDRPELAWREKALLSNPLFGPLWAAEACPHLVSLSFGSEVRAIGVSGFERVTFRRGFPAEVHCPASEWLTYGHLVVSRQPIEAVTLTRCDEVPIERWWDSLDVLRPLKLVALDSRSVTLPPTLQEQLPGTLVMVNGVPSPTLLLADERPGANPRTAAGVRVDEAVPGVCRTRTQLCEG